MTSDVTSQLGVPMLDNTPTQVTSCRGDPALDTREEVELSRLARVESLGTVAGKTQGKKLIRAGFS